MVLDLAAHSWPSYLAANPCASLELAEGAHALGLWLTSSDSPWNLLLLCLWTGVPKVWIYRFIDKVFAYATTGMVTAAWEGWGVLGRESRKQHQLGAHGSAMYQIKIKQRMSASENACQKLFTDLYFNHVICLCNSSCSLWGLCILFFFNHVFYGLNKNDSSFFPLCFSSLTSFNIPRKHSVWLKRVGISLKFCSYPILIY